MTAFSMVIYSFFVCGRMTEVQQQLQANALRQQEIERQLQSLEEFSDSAPSATDDLIDLSTDQL
jgi:hypothetical protein